MKKENTRKNKPSRLFFVFRILMIIALIAVTVPLIIEIIGDLVPVVSSVFKGGEPNAIKEQLASYGWKGLIVMTLLQSIQTLTIIIPTAAIWLISGITYGPLGIVTCVAGTVLANILVFSLSRSHGEKVLGRLFGEKFIKNNFLARSKYPVLLVAAVYIIPGLPVGVVPYLAGMTTLSFRQYILTSSIAILPSMICFNLIGDNIISGNWTLVLILGIFVILITSICFIFRKKLLAFVERFSLKFHGEEPKK